MKKAGNGYSKIIADARNRVRPAVRDFHKYWYLGNRFQYTPFLQYVHAPFRSKTLNFNSMGFRGSEFDSRRRRGIKRIGFFGSSALLGVQNGTDQETLPE